MILVWEERSTHRGRRLSWGRREWCRRDAPRLQALDSSCQGLNLLHQGIKLLRPNLGSRVGRRWRVLDRMSRARWRTSGGVGSSLASQLHGRDSGPSSSANCCWKLDPGATVGRKEEAPLPEWRVAACRRATSSRRPARSRWPGSPAPALRCLSQQEVYMRKEGGARERVEPEGESLFLVSGEIFLL